MGRCCHLRGGAISTVPALAPAWRSPAACSCARSNRSGGSGVGAGAARPTTSTSLSTVDERLAGALEREPELAPLLLAAGVVADVRVAERAQALGCRDGVMALGVGAVDDDLGVEVGNALAAAQRVDC